MNLLRILFRKEKDPEKKEKFVPYLDYSAYFDKHLTLRSKEPSMLNALINLFKENTYQELSTISQIMGAILNTFAKEKFVNGETDRNSAIDALCQLLQSHKTTTSE